MAMSDIDPLWARSVKHKIGIRYGTTARDAQSQLQKMGMRSGNVMSPLPEVHKTYRWTFLGLELSDWTRAESPSAAISFAGYRKVASVKLIGDALSGYT